MFDGVGARPQDSPSGCYVPGAVAGLEPCTNQPTEGLSRVEYIKMEWHPFGAHKTELGGHCFWGAVGQRSSFVSQVCLRSKILFPQPPQHLSVSGRPLSSDSCELKLWIGL